MNVCHGSGSSIQRIFAQMPPARITLYWQVPRTTDLRLLLSANQARSFPRECQVACSCWQSSITSPKSSRGSRTREPLQGSAEGFSSAAAAPRRGRPQAVPTAARPQPATSSSFPSRRARATTCQREPASRWASASPTTTRSTAHRQRQGAQRRPQRTQRLLPFLRAERGLGHHHQQIEVGIGLCISPCPGAEQQHTPWSGFNPGQGRFHRLQVGIDGGGWDGHLSRVGRSEGVSIALPVGWSFIPAIAPSTPRTGFCNPSG